MPIKDADYAVRLIDFPVGAGCDGMVMLDTEGFYNVYINARASIEAQKRALKHEIDHIIHDDMYGEKNIVDIEEYL